MKPGLTILFCLLSLSLFSQEPAVQQDSVVENRNFIERIKDKTSQYMDGMLVHMGPIDLNLGGTIRYSAFRGFYFGIPLSTNDRFSRHIRLSVFGGYWTKLRAFDYGAEGKWLINRERQMELGVRFKHKSSALGEFSNLDEDANLLSENQYRYTFYENVMARGNSIEAFYNTQLGRHFNTILTFGTYEKHYYLAPFDTLPTQHFTNAEVRLHFDNPSIWLCYQHSFKDVLGGEYDFDRLKLQVEKGFQTLFFGKFSMLLQAGYASASCPVMETFNLLGSYDLVGLYSPGSFATMRESEFFCDRFAALFLWHDFQGSLWDPDLLFFKPQLTVSTALGWGSPSLTYGYFESGFVVKGLFYTPWVNVGAGVFYRYGHYALPKTIDNFSFKYSITLAL